MESTCCKRKLIIFLERSHYDCFICVFILSFPVQKFIVVFFHRVLFQVTQVIQWLCFKNCLHEDSYGVDLLPLVNFELLLCKKTNFLIRTTFSRKGLNQKKMTFLLRREQVELFLTGRLPGERKSIINSCGER